MPISQETLLLIYGELRQLVDRIEALATVTDLKFSSGRRAVAPAELRQAIKALTSEARLAQRVAIARLLDDEPQIEVNPLTGEVRPN